MLQRILLDFTTKNTLGPNIGLHNQTLFSHLWPAWIAKKKRNVFCARISCAARAASYARARDT